MHAPTRDVAHAQGHEMMPIDRGWVAWGSRDDHGDAAPVADDPAWLPAVVPGTAAAVLRDAGRAAGD
ncbi:MAG: hypothetical protein ACJ77N_00580, partial [Chloroflexota bacterium]